MPRNNADSHDELPEEIERRVNELEHRRPLPECADRLKRIDVALFGNGEPEKSLTWRLGMVEQRQRKHGMLLWSTACMVGALFSKAALLMIEGVIETWQKSHHP